MLVGDALQALAFEILASDVTMRATSDARSA